MLKFLCLFLSLVQLSCQKDSPKLEPISAPIKPDEPINPYQSVSAIDYYKEWSGHRIEDIEKVFQGLKKSGCTSFIFYAGDSSLDNKNWLFGEQSKTNPAAYQLDEISAPAINGYENILKPARMIKDVDYWVNELLSEGQGPEGGRVCSIMTSIEATLLRHREQGLLPQDEFVRDHITKDDYLVVSVGGNDVALDPDEETKNAFARLKENPQDPQALSHLINLTGPKTKEYIEKLIEKNHPKNILVSMIYYPNETPGGWPTDKLTELGYYEDPKKLQNLIDFAFKNATQKIAIPGTKITPVALSEVLNGKETADYKHGVEPSVQGGKKMAELFLKKLFPKE